MIAADEKEKMAFASCTCRDCLHNPASLFVLLGSKLGTSGMADAEVYYLVSANNSLKEVRTNVPQETETSNMAFHLLERMKEDPKRTEWLLLFRRKWSFVCTTGG